MLKAIELYGFKSFADRTRLEFGEGISAVVGPNGSGKSNIVDAIKWVLGEQSVKKLRGSEMIDVIFSGSGTRQALGSAEVTLSFDNSKRTFDLETSEVHITRRIYRSGEGEYLINRQPVRLRDIKDILSGTGLGIQAYSIIEQGRVEMLLQTSSVQRRVIFEEAAGISRFNAKKQEVQRRLERVDQNLIRLSDIVNEVENQLKTVKSQAGKAQLYRQYTARLQELRIHASLVDWRKNKEQERILLEELETLAQEEAGVLMQLEVFEKSASERNSKLEESNRQIGRLEGDIIAVKERIFSEESTIELQMEQVQTLDAEIIQHGRQLLDLNLRSVDAEDMMRKTDDEIRRAQKFHIEIGNIYQQHLQNTEQLNRDHGESKEERTRLQKELEDKNRKISRISGELAGFESRVRSLQKNRDDARRKYESCERQLRDVSESIEQLRNSNSDLANGAILKKDLFENAKKQKNQGQETLNRHQQELLSYKQRLSGMSERISVLEELLRRHEGLSPGVKEVMRQSGMSESPFRFVHGLVADLFRVEVEVAPLIELALGSSAQHVVVSPEPELFRYIEKCGQQLPGRVGFIWLDPNPVEIPWIRGEGFDGRTGVLGRADRFVRSEPHFLHLAQRLLGRTWIVENIAIAKALYRESDDRTNFLTRNGEFLAADGTLVVGPASGSSGVITRRSELRTLSEQLQLIESQIRNKEIAINVQKNRIFEEEKEIEELEKSYRDALSELESKKNALGNSEERLKQISEQLVQLKEETVQVEEQYEKTTRELEELEHEKFHLENFTGQLEAELSGKTKELEELEKRLREHNKKTTNAKIEHAKSEERLDFLKDRIRQFEDHQSERQHLLENHRRRVQALLDRRDQALLSVLKLESSLAGLYVRKESLGDCVKSLSEDRNELLAQRNFNDGELKKSRQESNRIRNKTHSKQLELDRLSQEQKVLVDRMREDYDISLEEIDETRERLVLPSPGERGDPEAPDSCGFSESSAIPGEMKTKDREQGGENSPRWISIDLQSSEEEVEERTREIENLRQKIQKLGGVNLDAIETLEELETRFTTLSNQYQDLTNAKKSIEKIIEKINQDSQRLFEETFEGVKLHFQDLFQQLFGGGFADLKLEDENNILESGVDIVARPPGKELKSVSLLSGGEKTLTCVALLLAFFRYRPNPVCILDEVDAALDEGNVDRFVRVIKDFKAQTQFLLITHSKKTMGCANTMYGITMQDSGVSKPISVRFVDVGENGEILDTSYEETPPPISKAA